jgi:drug/metabolite transporter (DMT)-like permease
MLKLISLISIQSLFLVLSQVFLKLAMKKMDKLSFSWSFIQQLLKNYPFAFSGLCFVCAATLWMFILKKYEFSLAYPLVSMSYIIALPAAIYIFHEDIPPTRWIGVLVIIGGVYLVTRK